MDTEQCKDYLKGFPSDKKFRYDHFTNPEIGYAPIYSWMWNDVLSHEETDRQLEEMQRLGIKRFYILPIPKEFRPNSMPSRLYPDYLSKGYFEEYSYAIRRAHDLGMQVWIYDEGGWPSGAACGKVLAESDDYAKEFIRLNKKTLPQREPYAPSENTLISFCNGSKTFPGDCFSETVCVDEYIRVKVPWQGTFEVPDATKKEATEAFLRITHDKYQEVIGKYFGETVTAVFTDEPTGPRPFPYRKELSDAFFASFGKRIEDFFPVIFGVAPASDSAKKALVDWYDLCSKFFCDYYLKEASDWCHKHGLAFLGHMDKDDETNGSIRGGSYQIMRALRVLDVPGVDTIYRQIYPDKTVVEQRQGARKDGKYSVKNANGFFPRYASSAAAQTNKRHALTESFAVYGNGITFDEMRYVLNFQAIRGINVFNLMMLSYGSTDYLRTGELPHFNERNAAFQDLASFNLYLERLSYLVSLGERDVEIALYYPIRDSYVGEGFSAVAKLYEEIGAKLEQCHVDFDVADDDVILLAEDALLEKGIMHVGKANYRTIVIPACRQLSSEAQAKLLRFTEGGGRVILVPARENMITLKGGQAISLSDFDALFTPLIQLLGKADGITLSCNRMMNNERIYFLMNENPTATTVTFRLPEGTCYLIEDFSSEKIYFVPSKQKIMSKTLASGEMICILRTDDAVPSVSYRKWKEVGHIEKWNFKKTKELKIGDNDIVMSPVEDEFVPCRLGDWREKVGEAFSGSGVYESNFDWDPTHDCLIDLGNVKYTCALFINDKEYPVRVMHPYVYEIASSDLKEHNTIRLRVTNSCANAYHYTKSFEQYEKWQLTSYYEIEEEYLPDSFAGGLFGEVKLYVSEK